MAITTPAESHRTASFHESGSSARSQNTWYECKSQVTTNTHKVATATANRVPLPLSARKTG